MTATNSAHRPVQEPPDRCFGIDAEDGHSAVLVERRGIESHPANRRRVTDANMRDIPAILFGGLFALPLLWHMIARLVS